ncbi:MAG: TRAP transporter substrate-binding protein DctP [Chloroflexi bacterium]|nr:TRAP transporter substrate-binding protein DctP [Chloroflexota bacterium]
MSKRAKILGTTISILVIVTLVLTACAKPAPAPTVTVTTTATATAPAGAAPTVTVTATPTAAPPPTGKFSPVSLTHASALSSYSSNWGLGLKPFMDEVNRLTDNALTVKVNMAGALLGAKDILDGTVSGVADISYFNGAEFPAQLPSMQLGSVADPILSVSHPDEATWVMIAQLIANEFVAPEYDKAGLKYLWGVGASENTLFLNKNVATLDDFKGMKLRVWAGKYQARLYEAMGATAVPVVAADWADAIQKNLVNGGLTPLDVANSFGILPYTQFWMTNKKGSTSFYMAWLVGHGHAMNKKTWDSLTPDWKRALLKGAKQATTAWRLGHVSQFIEPAIVSGEKVGGKFINLPEADLQKLMKGPLMASVWDDAAKEVDAAGGKGTAMLTRIRELQVMPGAQIEFLFEQMWSKRIADLK